MTTAEKLRTVAHSLALKYVDGSVPVGCRGVECCAGCCDFYAELTAANQSARLAALEEAATTCRAEADCFKGNAAKVAIVLADHFAKLAEAPF